MKSEAEVQSEIMMEAAKHGILLMRNNSGAGKFIDEESGQESFVRFGLMNYSKEQNKRIKSSDLVGLTSTGRFIAVEVKKEDWKFKSTDTRAVAQLAYIDLVKARNGIAGFCQSVSDFQKLIGLI